MANVRDLLAIATGVGTGLAAARQQSRLEEQREAENEMLRNEREQFNSQINELMDDENLGADDVAQLSVIRRQGIAAREMMTSANPELQKLGRTMLENTGNELRGWTITQEAQAIERRAAEESFAQDQQNFVRKISADMSSDVNTNIIRPFLQSREQFEKVTHLLDTDERLAADAALTSFIQSIDNSVVREGERLSYQGSNGLVMSMVEKMNSWRGSDYDPELEASIRNSAAALYNARTKTFQRDLASQRERADALGVDPSIAFAGVPQQLSRLEATDIGVDATGVNRQGERTAAPGAITETSVPTPPGTQTVIDIFGERLDTRVAELAAEQGFTDYTVHEDGTVRSSDGSVIPLPRGVAEQVRRAVRTQGGINAN